MTVVRNILIAAAALVGGGAALTVALQQSMENAGISDCNEWEAVVRRAAGRDAVTWWVAVQDGYQPPAVAAGRVIGDRVGTVDAGNFQIVPAGCSWGLSYEYTRGASAAGWRIYRLDGDRYFARAWELLASSVQEVLWLGGWSEVKANCTQFTAEENCRAMLSALTDCWMFPNGNICRYGLEYGPDLGGVHPDGTDATCVADTDSVPYPCDWMGRVDSMDRELTSTLDVSEE